MKRPAVISLDRFHGVCRTMYPIGGPEMGWEVAVHAANGYSSSVDRTLIRCELLPVAGILMIGQSLERSPFR
jgi:hypothetical protein